MKRGWWGLGGVLAAFLAMAALSAEAEAGKSAKRCEPRKQRCSPTYTIEDALSACRGGNHSAVVAVLGGESKLLDGHSPDHVEARYCLGIAYLDGVDYRGKGYYRAKASEVLVGAANENFRDAKARLEALQNKRADLSDPSTAVAYFASLAEKGCTGAMLKLADHYEKGFGIVKSDEMKRRLIFQAMLRGDPEALGRVVKMYESPPDDSSPRQGAELRVMLYVLQNLRAAQAGAAAAPAFAAERDAAAQRLPPKEQDRAERIALAVWLTRDPRQPVECPTL